MSSIQHFILLALTLTLCCSAPVEDASEECKDVHFTANSGEFTSPNYPNAYPHSAACKWTITAPAGHRIRLSFAHFDIRDTFYDCKGDFVTISPNKSTTLTYCGDSGDRLPPDNIESTGTELIVTLTSEDFFDNGQGFEAKYVVITKDGVPLEGGEDEDEEDDWDETDPVTESTTTTTPKSATTSEPTTTPTTTRRTTSPSTPTTRSTTTSTTRKTTTLTEKVTDGVKRPADDDNTGISNNPGAMSGAVIGSIIGAVLIIFGIILIVAFVHWRRNKNQRIDLSTVEIDDGKTLIKKKYKKQNNKIVRIPEAETFPL